METMELPRFVVIKSASNETYLQLPIGNSPLLKFKELGGDSKGVKHEVVKAESGHGLVHIKCCQTDKYWTLALTHGNVIAAEASQRVEDETSDACTLMKPSVKYIGGVMVVNFQFQRESKWHSIVVNSMGCLESSEKIAEDFIVSDWAKLSSSTSKSSSSTSK